MGTDQLIEKRFWSNIMPEPNSGCWIWLGTLAGYKNWYGRFYVSGKCYRAHRFSYMFYKGPIPEGLHIHHKCKNTYCVNPDHLAAVTHKENCQHRTPAKGFKQNRYQQRCKYGHSLTDKKNVLITSSGRNVCKICRRWRKRAQRHSWTMLCLLEEWLNTPGNHRDSKWWHEWTDQVQKHVSQIKQVDPGRRGWR